MMNASEKLCLKWNDFQENISSSFGELRSDKDFTDVTLACTQMEAHKVILASSSPFFLAILKKNKHPHPLLYMRGVNSEILMAIIDFLYVGKANVCQENLDSFLALAEELKLKGLTETVAPEVEPDLKSETKRVEAPFKEERNNPNKAPTRQHSETLAFEEADTSLALNSYKISVELDDLDEQIKSMMTKSDVSSGIGQGNMATCNVCGKEGPAKGMPRHIEANHIDGVSHSCDICGKISRSRNALRKHIYIYHRDISSDLAGPEIV